MVRDRAIYDAHGAIAHGRLGKLGEALLDIDALFSQEQRALLSQIVVLTVDETLHHLLWSLEQVKWIKVSVETDAGIVPDIVGVSDGLTGDIWDWIPRFSEFEPSL
jgi:hypothetical protein